MEDIIQFVLLVGVLFVGFVIQYKKKGRQMTEEAFPPLSVEVEEEEEREEEKSPVRTVAPRRIMPVAKQSVPTPSHSAAPVQPKLRESRIDLRSPRKAREAFISSEIFNRKY